ncbi:hypothetical protein, partial [Lysinibacillus sp. D3C2_S12]|uniref:hypothetical protein n=1 Tax=Lysinibacillus sp. D3C2_S12 TaxID=2941226 RepID=UPI0020BDDA1A
MVAYVDINGDLYPSSVGQDGIFIIHIEARLVNQGQSISVFIFKSEGIVGESVLVTIPYDPSAIIG